MMRQLPDQYADYQASRATNCSVCVLNREIFKLVSGDFWKCGKNLRSFAVFWRECADDAMPDALKPLGAFLFAHTWRKEYAVRTPI